MPLMRIELDSDKNTARRVQQLYQAGKIHRESREAARDEVWRRGRTPASDPMFVGITADLLARTPWRGRTVHMYDRVVAEPRLTFRWVLGDGPEPPDDLREMARVLSERYDVQFSQIGVNLYRDGADSVAWHGDRVARELSEAVVALVSLGAVRPFRLRPTGGGSSVLYRPGPGDLLVMGGSCQRTWQHSVPKCRGVGPRISVQFRHA
ncbi:MAG TPA: alpha-ketoglutarate-dependent dioxygenase AlkB [Micromonospora sp.]